MVRRSSIGEEARGDMKVKGQWAVQKAQQITSEEASKQASIGCEPTADVVSRNTPLSAHPRRNHLRIHCLQKAGQDGVVQFSWWTRVNAEPKLKVLLLQREADEALQRL